MVNEKIKKETEAPVALIFFNRPLVFEQVFEAVRSARPSRLFLIQDGPRPDRPADAASIADCRKIAERIDWPCDVQRNYSDVNLGCGRRVSSGLTWAFEHTDRLIILEDDTVPSPDMFRFCGELLERYKTDTRMGMITGVNHLGQYRKPGSSYFFATCGSIAGWATWKRVWDSYDYKMKALDDPYQTELLRRVIYPPFLAGRILGRFRGIRQEVDKGGRISSWSSQFGLNTLLNSQLVIVPAANLITNIGLVAGATNGGTSLRILPRGLRPVFYMPAYPLAYPLKHPEFVVEDRMYNDAYQRVMIGGTTRTGRFLRWTEAKWRVLLYRYLKR